jgi:hypothetical protein
LASRYGRLTTITFSSQAALPDQAKAENTHSTESAPRWPSRIGLYFGLTAETDSTLPAN